MARQVLPKEALVMRRLGVWLLLSVLAQPALAEGFPTWGFVVDSLNGKDVRGKKLFFEADRGSPEGNEVPTATGFGGCNEWRAKWESPTDSDEFFLTDLTVTEKACPDEEVMQIEKEYVAALAKVTHYREEGRTLFLTGDGVDLQLSEDRFCYEPLTATGTISKIEPSKRANWLNVYLDDSWEAKHCFLWFVFVKGPLPPACEVGHRFSIEGKADEYPGTFMTVLWGETDPRCD
jgi:heat shock protein HslJ